jgi:hypothetical protein
VAKQFIKLRVSPQVELEGLDMAEFGSVCYPDFVLAQSSMSPGHAPSSVPPGGESAPDATPAPALGGDRA